MANKTKADELDEQLGGEGFEDEVDIELDGDIAAEGPSNAPFVLDDLDLNGVVELDFRPLRDGNYYDFEIVAAEGGRSGAGNKQVTFTLMVVDTDEVDGEGASLNGVTINDYAGVDPRKPNMHWKIKAYAKYTGQLNENGTLKSKDPKSFIGGRLRAQVKIDVDYNPEEPRNKIARIAPSIPLATAKTKATA